MKGRGTTIHTTCTFMSSWHHLPSLLLWSLFNVCAVYYILPLQTKYRYVPLPLLRTLLPLLCTSVTAKDGQNKQTKKRTKKAYNIGPFHRCNIMGISHTFNTCPLILDVAPVCYVTENKHVRQYVLSAYFRPLQAYSSSSSSSSSLLPIM